MAACVIPEDAWYVMPEGDSRVEVDLVMYDEGEAKYEVNREAWGLLPKASDIGDPESGAEQPPTAQSDATQLTGGLQPMAAAANYFKPYPERGSVVPEEGRGERGAIPYQSIRQSHPDLCHTAELEVAT